MKAIAIYRDNCKVAQPLSSSGKAVDARRAPPVLVARSAGGCPIDRTEVGRKFQVGEYEGYIHVGLLRRRQPGRHLRRHRQGRHDARRPDELAHDLAVSMGLQYGVPLEVYVSKFSHMRFEPSGLTNDPTSASAKSIVDYIFRWIGKKFLTADQQEEAGILSAEVKARLAQRYADGGEAQRRPSPARRRRPARPRSSTRRRTRSSAPAAAAAWCATGSCYTCRDCGTNTGCS